MKLRFVMLAFLMLVPCFPAQAKLALVFGGDGTGSDDPSGTLASAVNAAQAAGFEVQVVTTLLPVETLTQASLWIQPGGPNFDQAADMQRSGVFQQVRDFVASGGGYVGYCGGAYMAQSYGSLGLGLLPGMAWHQGEETRKTEVIWEGKRRFIHFEYGPRFQTGPGIEVFATYVSNGAPAAIRGKYGQGRVVLSGPHPEAMGDWEPTEDPDGSDLDLAIEMMQSAAR
jgi:glutamine amidotransferase-like uncharacterized protein